MMHYTPDWALRRAARTLLAVAKCLYWLAGRLNTANARLTGEWQKRKYRKEMGR